MEADVATTYGEHPHFRVDHERSAVQNVLRNVRSYYTALGHVRYVRVPDSDDLSISRPTYVRVRLENSRVIRPRSKMKLAHH